MSIASCHKHWLSLLAICCLATPPVSAQDLKCFVLTPPEQILPGVKRIAIADFSVAFGGLGDLFKLDGDNKASSPEAAVELCLTEIVTDLADYIAPSFQEQKLEFASVEGDQFKRMIETAKNELKRPISPSAVSKPKGRRRLATKSKPGRMAPVRPLRSCLEKSS